MSDSEKSVDEFEQLLASVAPAQPSGSAMQIMYIAGQQSASDSRSTHSRSQSANWVWKAATLISTSAAACLLFILSDRSTPEGLPTIADMRQSTQEVIVAQTTVESPSKMAPKRPSEWLHRPQSRRIAMFDIAQRQPEPSSIDMFDDFKVKPLNQSQWVKEPQQ